MGAEIQKTTYLSIKSDAGYAAENEGKAVPKFFLKKLRLLVDIFP